MEGVPAKRLGRATYNNTFSMEEIDRNCLQLSYALFFGIIHISLTFSETDVGTALSYRDKNHFGASISRKTNFKSSIWKWQRRHFRKLLEVARFSPRDVTMAKIVGTNKLPSSPPSPAGRSLWAVRAQRKGNHCRYFIFFQKSGRPMFCSCLVFYLTIFPLPDLEKRDENQEIEKTKVSGGRMTDNFWRSVWNPIQVLFILKVLWIKVLINPNL